MKYQGQFITVSLPLEGQEGSYPALYQVSEERAEEIHQQILVHWKACHDGTGTDAQTFLQTLPVDATTLGELALTALFLGQFMNDAHREARNPLAAILEAVGEHVGELVANRRSRGATLILPANVTD